MREVTSCHKIADSSRRFSLASNLKLIVLLSPILLKLNLDKNNSSYLLIHSSIHNSFKALN